VVRDKLWFLTAHRSWGTQEYSNTYYNKNQGIYVGSPHSGVSLYEPDLDREAFTDYPFRDHTLRLTWQAAEKHKITGHYSWQKNCMCRFQQESGGFAPEGNGSFHFTPSALTAFTWTHPATNRLLFQAGVGYMRSFLAGRLQPEVSRDDIAITDLTTNFAYNSHIRGGFQNAAGPNWGKGSDVSQHNERFSMSYVTGSHSIKAGLFMISGREYVNGTEISGPHAVDYRLRGPDPVQIVQHATPGFAKQEYQEVSLFAQDQWVVNQMTLNLGVRFDRITGLIPEQDKPAGRFVPAIHVDRIEGVPNFTDLSPRLGVSYDLRGDGRTALKATVGRYLVQFGTTLTRMSNPVNSLVATAARTWADANGNYIPDCDLGSFDASGECGALDNRNFGTLRPNLRFSDQAISGFGNREFQWQTSLSLQHELVDGVGATVGYHRTWFGNQRVNDNVLVTPEDFDPFCVTAPVDARLPNGGGYQVCDGLADVKPEKFGLVDTVVKQASEFGGQKEVFDGIDVNLNARFGAGRLVQGGMSVGRTATGCIEVDRPLQFCDVTPPFFRPALKLSGVYPLPFWGVASSVTFQNLPGSIVGSTASGATAVDFAATNAQIAPSLGRNLAQGPSGVVLVSLVAPHTVFEERLTQVDVRFSKILELGRTKLQGMFDVYNLFNEDSILSEFTRYGASFRVPRGVLGARMFKVGVQLSY
jgi:hypothetical protein